MSLLDPLRRLDRALFPDLLVEGLRRELEGAGEVLDVGCGSGGPLLKLPKPARLVGLDGHQPSLDQLRTAGHYDELICGPLEGRGLADKSFDVVTCLDVIEHFEKPQALALVLRLERLARRKVLLATPNGFLPSGVFDDNPYQVHRCGFTAAELRALGYRVRGTGGPKWLRGQFAEPRLRPHALWHRVSGLVQPLTWTWPEGAFALLAVKELEP